MACSAFGKTDAGKKANAEFQKLFLKDDSPALSDAPASTTTDAPVASDTQASTTDVPTASGAPLPSQPADDLPNSLEEKRQMMNQLLKTNADMHTLMKCNKKKIQQLRNAIRATAIRIWLLRPSGERFDITAPPDFTVSKLKKSIDFVYGFASCFQRLIANDAGGAPVEMKNNKRLYTYGVEMDDAEISFVMTGGNNVPTPAVAEGDVVPTPAVAEGDVVHAPAVVETDSEEEDITETPPISDDDVAQEPLPKPWNMRLVSVKDFVGKYVRFYGKVDMTSTLDTFLDYILTFEDLTEEQVDMLAFCDDRGNPYASSLTVQQCMDTSTFTSFYIKVKGMKGGAGVKMTQVKRNAKIQQLNFRVQSQKKELDELKKSDNILEAQVIVEKFSTNSEKDAIRSIKGYVGGNTLENLLKMQAVLSADDKNKPEVKVRNCASAFFGEKLMEIENDCEAKTALIVVCKSVLETAYISACAQNDKFNLSVFRKIVDDAVIFKQGQKSSSSQAVDALAQQMADTHMG
eukprot:Skav229713  [mRNA]  locus=scaffold49:171885:173438:+ [translate_table: standard]